MASCQDTDGNCAVLQQFYKVLKGLDSTKPEKTELVNTVLSLAKYNNKFGAVDKLMKQFAKCMLEGGLQTEHIVHNLQILLNTEVAVKR